MYYESLNRAAQVCINLKVVIKETYHDLHLFYEIDIIDTMKIRLQDF